MATDIELRDFIKNTLVQIAVGVSEANKEMHEEHGGQYEKAPFRLHKNLGDHAKTIPGISFDVAVTVSSGTTDKAGAKISVAQILGIGATIEASSEDRYVHRIRFDVGLHIDWD